MARIAGKGGNVYVAPQLVENCEDAWSADDAAVTASLDSADYRSGSGSAKFVITAALSSSTLAAHEDISSLDLTDYTAVMCWLKTSVALDAGDWQILLDDTSGCVSPIEELDIPAIEADTWTPIRMTLATPASLGAVVSVGLKQITDKGAMNLWIDDVRASVAVAGMKSWSLDQKVETIDVTGFDSDGVKEFVAGTSEWAGSFEGFKDGVPLAIGTQVFVELRESSTSTQQFRGAAIITGRSAKTDITGAVTYSYTFQGLHALTIPTT